MDALPTPAPAAAAVSGGRSTENCRIEYLWRFLKTHVTGKFRACFFEMMKRGLLMKGSEIDLFYLQTIFVPIVQSSLDRFRRMWNEHLISGLEISLP